MTGTKPPSALHGLRVLDLTQVAAGPYTTLLLALMGAEVIKVESCSRMDINRGRANPMPGDPRLYPNGEPGETPWNRTAHHVHRNINKLAVTLDLATVRGKELFLDLARISDVLVENYRASVMDRLGLGYEVVSQVNPQLVYAKISSQGSTGPEKDYGSLGSTLEQTAGLASVTGYEDQIPSMSNETFPDPVVGLLAVGAVMAGLRRRSQRARGCFVDLSQREATINLMGESYLDYSVNGVVAKPMGNRHPEMSPQGVYPSDSEDMWVAITVRSEAEWQGLCQALEQPELVQDPRFSSAESRSRNRDDLDRIIAAWTNQRDHYQAMHLLQARGVAAGAVLKGSELIEDPHLEARGFWDAGRPSRSGELQADHHPMDSFQKSQAAGRPRLGSGRTQQLRFGRPAGADPKRIGRPGSRRGYRDPPHRVTNGGAVHWGQAHSTRYRSTNSWSI